MFYDSAETLHMFRVIDGKVWCWHLGGIWDIGPGFAKVDYLFPMQYTGMEDKHGRKIYEGDIVEAKWTNIIERGVIVYKEEIAAFRLERGRDSWNMESCLSKEVLGNIYEHSHLLGE